MSEINIGTDRVIISAHDDFPDSPIRLKIVIGHHYSGVALSIEQAVEIVKMLEDAIEQDSST